MVLERWLRADFAGNANSLLEMAEYNASTAKRVIRELFVVLRMLGFVPRHRAAERSIVWVVQPTSRHISFLVDIHFV